MRAWSKQRGGVVASRAKPQVGYGQNRPESTDIHSPRQPEEESSVPIRYSQ
jgi:hypothetical protein